MRDAQHTGLQSARSPKPQRVAPPVAPPPPTRKPGKLSDFDQASMASINMGQETLVMGSMAPAGNTNTGDKVKLSGAWLSLCL